MARTESTWDPSSRETILLFFFQAEDGIRDLTVTGVQTCALPISRGLFLTGEAPARHWLPAARLHRRQRPRHLPRRAAAHARGGVAGQSLDGSDDPRLAMGAHDGRCTRFRDRGPAALRYGAAAARADCARAGRAH